MTLRLVSADGNLTFELRPGLSLVLGRALSCDLPVLDPTVSRRHAELVVEAASVTVRDLGSSNGTFYQGVRTTEARLTPGERVVFGKVSFDVRQHTELLIDDSSAEVRRRAARAGTTIIRQVPVPDADQALEQALLATGSQAAIEGSDPAVTQVQRDRQKLMLLVEVSKALTRSTTVEGLLDRMLQFTFRLLDVDYVAIWLYDGGGTLSPRTSRTRTGAPAERDVSLALVKTVVEQKVAIVSDADAGAAGGTETVRSIWCAPLIASEGRVLGVLYVDGPRPSVRVSDEDLDFLVAFAGIGAVALDNIRFGERIRLEARIRENFERFFTPHMAERIAAMPESLRLGGERRHVAVLFADIRGFTPLAARMEPDETAALLTEFFTEMVDCVFRHGGTLDKFIGDAVMAQWGAPISSPDDPDLALAAARDMLDAVDELNRGWRANDRPEISVGIGLNYGEAFAGYTGSERRLEYTVIGDTVNTARRVCDWADGGEILMSEPLRAALTREHAIQSRDPLTLRGKPKPVVVFRALR
ncbi:MAG: FHA domain-containing protein [Gemmatimonadaceae bacterium]|nr:FHA domain-containing protein [Gemmatimonadaceae bacterium]